MLLIGAVVFRYFWVRYPRRSDGSECPACGYARTGLSTELCPECGTRWGEGGRARTPAWVEVCCLMLLLLIVCVLIPLGALWVVFRFVPEM